MNLLRFSIRLSSLTVLLFAFSGCAGYHLGSVKPASLQHIESIAVPTFKNRTLEPRTSVMITNAVIKRFQEDGTYRISNRDKADAVLQATFIEVDRSQLRAVATDQLETRELGVRLAVEYQLVDTNTNTILKEGTVYGNTEIFLDPNLQLSERQAFPLAANELAGQLVSHLSEGW